jgi:hypothetical protein
MAFEREIALQAQGRPSFTLRDLIQDRRRFVHIGLRIIATMGAIIADRSKQ